jgi:hypothetical protein
MNRWNDAAVNFSVGIRLGAKICCRVANAILVNELLMSIRRYVLVIGLREFIQTGTLVACED